MTRYADVLLATVPNNMEKIAGLGAKFITPMAPHGLMYIASYLCQQGLPCAILDSFALGLGVKETVEQVRKSGAKVAGFSVFTSQAFIVIEIAKELRRSCPSVKIVLGNQHADIFADWFLERDYADAVVHGDGEETFLELCQAYLAGKSPVQVPGISFRRDDGTVTRTQSRPVLYDLDKIPPPAWDLVPHHLYRLPFYSHPKGVSASTFKNIFTSRGCPFSCIFCTVHHGRTMRYHSVERVLDELERLVHGMGAEFVFIMDSNFTVDRKRITQICQGIIDRKLKFEWGCEGRADFIARDPEILHIMRKAGCAQIPFGLESGDQKILDDVGKKITLEQVRAAIRETRAAGIEPVGLFMLGLPGETEATMRKTIDLAKELPLGYAQFGITVPYPGTALYYELVEKKKIDPYDWESFSQYASLTGKKVVYVPDGLDKETLARWQKTALREYYLRLPVVIRTLKHLRPGMLPELLYSAFIILSDLFRRKASPVK